jgi:hypothetical protein
VKGFRVGERVPKTLYSAAWRNKGREERRRRNWEEEGKGEGTKDEGWRLEVGGE